VIRWPRELLVCLLLSAAFGIFVCSASDKMLNRQDYRQESVAMERAILRGQPFYSSGHLVYAAPWQNRVLFPSVLELGIHFGILTAGEWYVLLRLLFCVAMFAVFWLALRTDAKADIKLAGTGLLLLSYCLVLTFTTPYGMTSDFPDATFAVIFIVLSLRRKRWLLLPVSVLAAVNRESSAFAGVIWLFMYGIDDTRRIHWKEVCYSAWITISSLIFVLLLRYGFGGSKAITSHTQRLPIAVNFHELKTLVLHPTPFSWAGLIFATILPVIMWILSNRESLTLTQKRLLGTACAIAFVSLLFGYVGEPRIFIPSIVITIFVAVWAEATHKTLRMSPFAVKKAG
jgi:hypothetical protein